MKDALQKARERKFYGVALALIVIGAGIFVFGSIQFVLQVLATWQFGWPMAKVIGGLIVMSLGYIILELELLRQPQD